MGCTGSERRGVRAMWGCILSMFLGIGLLPIGRNVWGRVRFEPLLERSCFMVSTSIFGSEIDHRVRSFRRCGSCWGRKVLGCSRKSRGGSQTRSYRQSESTGLLMPVRKAGERVVITEELAWNTIWNEIILNIWFYAFWSRCSLGDSQFSSKRLSIF